MRYSLDFFVCKTRMAILLIGLRGLFIQQVPANPVYSLENTEDTLIMRVGERKLLFPEVDRNLDLVWSTGNQDVVIVKTNGEALAVGEGRTYVSVYSTGDPLKRFRHLKVEASLEILGASSSIPRGIVQEISPTSKLVLEQVLRDKPALAIDSRFEISANKRYLVLRDTGKPFLFLSQTLWSIARRLNREEIVQVLDICKNQGFTSIQLIAHSHYMGPNVYGATPFAGEDFTQPSLTPGNSLEKHLEYDWWDHLEFIIEECVARELMVCLLPTWREQWNQKKNLNGSNAFAYGAFIGTRFRHLNPWIIWVLGGDEAPDTDEKLGIHRELARGIAQGINGRERYDNLVMTYHTHGPTSTTDFIPPGELFMDFHTIQSGHSLDNLEGMMERAYNAVNNPVLDFEPLYGKDGVNTHEVRTTIYWGIFAGGFGVSYGSWNTWHCGERDDLATFSIPGAFFLGFEDQIKHLGRLLLFNESFSRIPDQSLLLDNQNRGFERVLVSRAEDNSYLMVFTPTGRPFTINTHQMNWKRMKVMWFNPRDGQVKTFRPPSATSTKGHLFTPPTSGEPFTGNDWVLILQRGKK
jgi:hypothetical protein